MGLLRRTKAEEEEDDGFGEPDPAPEAPPVAYRVAGDLEVRAAEQQQEIADLKRQMKAMEREVYATRKTLRARKAVRATSIGGLGAFVGSILGGILYGLTDRPEWLVGATVVCFVLGFVATTPWRADDDGDDNFPKAPPPRMF